MSSSSEISTSVSSPLSTSSFSNTAKSEAPISGAANLKSAASTHPLLLAAVLVWLSIDLIGDGLLALRSLLESVSSERSVTPS